jgi:hypothetical protein
MTHVYKSVPQSSSETSLLQEKRREKHHEADIVIVGAGIAGTALAVALGTQGRSVILLDRSLKEPDRIVGELLQPGGVHALQKIGLGGQLACFSYRDMLWISLSLTYGHRLSRTYRCYTRLWL